MIEAVKPVETELPPQLGEVVGRLRSANASITGGDVSEGKRCYVVRTEGDFTTPEQVRGIVLRSAGASGVGGLGRVTVDDIADVSLQYKELKAEIRQRDREVEGEALARLARHIATAALRFFMVKATTTRVIAFDFAEAVSFEGETGPYLQYSMVRERNIRRKLEAAGMPTEVSADEVRGLDEELWADELWDLVLTAAQTAEVVEKAAGSLELSLIARQALDLAGKFHGVYHHHPILHEPDADLRRVRMAANQVFRKTALAILDILGVPVPEKM